MIDAQAKGAAPAATGERPREGVTPSSLLTLHLAGYRAVHDRLGTGRILDVGCGEGFATSRLVAPGRTVIGVDADAAAVAAAAAAAAAAQEGRAGRDPNVVVGRMDALALAFGTGSFDAVCSSHVVEHFAHPELHVAETARVLADAGTAYYLTPNAPADFENPYHLCLFGPAELEALLRRYYADVCVRGLDAGERVKADFAARRAKAARLLRIDVLGLRHHIPRRWYVALYARLLPFAYRLVARGGETTTFSVGDWFVRDAIDETTPVLFAQCRGPRRAGAERAGAEREGAERAGADPDA